MSVIERIPDPANFAHQYPPLFNYNGKYPARGRNMQVSSPSDAVQHSPSPHASGSWNPTFDLRDDWTAYELQADLPGVDQNDLLIEFISEDTLRISGHKKSLQESRLTSDATANEDAVSSDEELHERIESIDAAIAGPCRNARRTSIVNASTYQAPSETIDQWGALMSKSKSNTDDGRRSSITNAQARQQANEEIDAHSHHNGHSAQRREYRRRSVVDASARQLPAIGIDAATTGPAVMLTSPVQKYGVPRPIPEENIDAATVGTPRKADMVDRPRSRRRSRVSPQPYLFTERPAGSFDREFRFPTRIVKEELKSVLQDGVLTVIVPKKALPSQAKRGTSSL